MRCAVDEVAECNKSGRETDRGAIKGGDEDLGMCVECAGDVEIVGDEVLEPVMSHLVGTQIRGNRTPDADIGTSIIVLELCRAWVLNLLLASHERLS